MFGGFVFVAAGVAGLSACDTSDTFALRNATAVQVSADVMVDRHFTWYDCEQPRARAFDGGVTVDIAPGTRACFEGPVSGSEYDARERLLHLTVQRQDASAPCIDGTGETVRDRFQPEQDHKTLRLDDSLCPGPGALGSAMPAIGNSQ